ncbi:MAG: hypothetical protein KDA57_14065 [Planctomycetales bacterium]|nr:hypothetical protein [Planctomycetales bacterium]
MDSDIVLESILYASPWLLIAAVFYIIAWWKKLGGESYYSNARNMLSEGKVEEARESFLCALWKANEEPHLERAILAELRQFYDEAHGGFRPEDYEKLIVQYERLSTKGSHKAFAELKEVQAAKSYLIEQMRTAA